LYLAQKNAHVVLEDSAFFDAHVEPDLFKIPKFFPAGIFPRLSEYFSPDVWEEMLLLKERGKSMIEQLYEGGLPIHYVQEMNSAGPSCAAPTTIIKITAVGVIEAPPLSKLYYVRTACSKKEYALIFSHKLYYNV